MKSCTDKHIGVKQTHCDQSIEREHHQKRYILAHCCTGGSRQERLEGVKVVVEEGQS